MSGRSYKRTPEVEKRLLDAIRVGSTFRLACAYARIDHATFYRWLEKDATFATQVKEAEGGAVVGWLAKIEKAASEGTWQAAAWKLERRYPEDYGRREHVEQEISGPGGGPIQTEDVSLDDTDRTARILALIERAGKRASGFIPGAEPDLDATAGAATGGVA